MHNKAYKKALTQIPKRRIMYWNYRIKKKIHSFKTSNFLTQSSLFPRFCDIKFSLLFPLERFFLLLWQKMKKKKTARVLCPLFDAESSLCFLLWWASHTFCTFKKPEEKPRGLPITPSASPKDETSKSEKWVSRGELLFSFFCSSSLCCSKVSLLLKG